MTENNPAQWPSFDNWSSAYAHHAQERLVLLNVAATFIQRWWRNPKRSSMKAILFPVKINKKRYWIHHCRSMQNKKDPLLESNVHAWEKLDGTNLGCRCDGAVFGRRKKVTEASYQKCTLKGVIPDKKLIQRVKQSILGSPSPHSLLVYGELMCNSTKFGYNMRQMDKKWYAFGAVIDTARWADPKKLAESLSNKGFFASTDKGSSKISLLLNDKLYQIYQKHSIPCVPLLSKGPLRSVCMALTERMMDNEDLEGVVLVGSDLLTKWKTGKEDESKGHFWLTEIVEANHSDLILSLADVDKQLLVWLTTISGNKLTPSDNKRKVHIKPKKQPVKAPYNEDELVKAYSSALTKFDSVDSYFARDALKDIMGLLTEELRNDLKADTKDERKCVNSYVRKCIGKSFGAWKKSLA